MKSNKKGRPKKEETKKRVSVRLYDRDKNLLIERFGGLQRAIDHLIKKLKGE